MHISKVEYFQKKYPEENCLSGITTSSINDLSVGTPCIAIVKPFVKHETPKGGPGLATYKSAYTINGQQQYVNTGYGKPKKPSKKQDKDENRVKAVELYDMDIDKANRIIRNSFGKVKLLFTHIVWPGDKDFITNDVKNSSFYFNGVKPLIHDGCLRAEADSFYDIHSPDEMKSIDDIILDQLKDHRYINYTVINVAKSNATSLLTEMLRMTKTISKQLPHRVCFFYNQNSNRSVIDTISVSFYRLSDSIAIFDSRRAVGMCMEIFLSSSAVKDVTYPNKTMCWKFLFCKYRDNAFSIDGEKIQRPSDISASDGLSEVQSRLLKHVANDGATRKKLKTAKVSRGG